ncbi:hypothetical protein AT246_07630 [Bartonella henselae]|nr:hypothetical protein AT247_07140 [Bartonella henselae]OLL51103.1 hypothetical protein AT241_06300 [Bartonella henselae]OLL57303.1 hypothetical protein AT246_07630 [Bartonella henselae]
MAIFCFQQTTLKAQFSFRLQTPDLSPASMPASQAQTPSPAQPKAGFPTLLKTRQPFYSSSQVLLRTRSFSLTSNT